jgi:cell division protein FtsI (penicillin-binding protein 3)
MSASFGTAPRLRITLLAIGLTASLGLVGARLYAIQIIQHGDLGARAEGQYERRIPVTARRGTIHDRSGRALVISLDAASVFAHPGLVRDPGATAARLARVLKLPPQEIQTKLRSDGPFVWIQRKVDPEQAEAVVKLNLPGIGLVPEAKRYYPKKTLAAHLIGFVGVDDRGLEGLELEYDRLLTGGPRSFVSRVDALQRIVFRESGESRPGADLYLTIDEVVQHVAERELDAVVRRSGARGGTVIVTDPTTGEVLALANTPSYNPSAYVSSAPTLRRNRALTDPYEPGSAFKLVLAAAALEEGLVKPEDLFYGEEGVIEVAGVKIRDHEKYGWMTFRDVMAFSSNVGAIKVGMMLGKDRFYTYITSFGFGVPTGVDLPGESRGLVRRPRHWSELSLGALSIGHEVSVTPIQLITAMGAVANGGHLVRPYVLRAIRHPDGSVEETRPLMIRRVISSETARTLTSVLTEVVERGTGRAAALNGYRVAGKTGTAQKIDPQTGTYSHSKVVAFFVGYVPAENPRLAILVLIDEPQGLAWGGTLAAPVFREIAEETLNYLDVPPVDRGEERLARRPDEAPSRVN